VPAIAVGSALSSIFSALRNRLPAVQALILVHSDGSAIDECGVPHLAFDADALAHEYLPLLQIARRASEDMGAGDIAEHIVVTGSAMVVTIQLPSGHFSIVVASRDAHLGRLRYEIKRLNGDLERCLKARK
jgi:predicted regulator of Ras-like GTPase activity (Roadblock/LC7/MglB family)